MLPTLEQIRDAAYYRWQRHVGEHGRDRDDWLRAEQDLLFSLNYRVVTRVGAEPPPSPISSGNGKHRDADPVGRVCRFCEQTAPRVQFRRAPVPGSPPALRDDGGTPALVVPDECDDCRESFEEGAAADVARFVRSVRDAWAAGISPASAPMSPAPPNLSTYVPIAAFKGLTRMALACLPRGELAAFEDAIEWVLNPGHDLDAGTFGPLPCLVHAFSLPSPAPWATLSLRVDDRAPMPHALFHLGDGPALFQIAVPLCTLDDDHDGEPTVVPRVAPPSVPGPPGDPIASGTISLRSVHPTRVTSVVKF